MKSHRLLSYLGAQFGLGRLFLLCLWSVPAIAQNPPVGRELPMVCTSGACTGGVSQWAAPGPGAPTRSVNGTRMLIKQPRQREIFNWASFDVAAGHSVEFQQAFRETAVALNRVLGTTNPKSFINGTVKAPGEVYVINQNGILFGPKAQINVHSLTASSLKLWNEQEFLTGGLTAAIRKVDGAGVPAPEAAFDQSGPAGAVDVAKGAHIKSANGGRVLLVAPQVRNAGTIETPGGQTVLAGSYDKVYVAASNDPNLRGLVVEVDTGGRVDNVGEIIAERGNVSMVGLAVNQDGIARATTAVNFNGSVRLAARHKTGPASIVNQSGNVTINSEFLQTTPSPGDPLQDFGVRLGKNSVTEVLPERSADAAIDASPQRRSQVTAFGKTVRMESGARITAPGGAVSLRAVSGDIPGEVRLAKGAVIDVAGTTDTVLPMSANVASLELRGNELADFPLHRDGALRGREVAFDMRELRFVENAANTAADDQYFLPIGNVTAAVSSVRRSVGERLADGGSITIDADRVTLSPGSLIDFSGGKVTYEAGFVQTSLLLSQGRVFDINHADPLLVYDAVLPFIDVDYQRWGVTDRFNVFGLGYRHGRFEEGYVVGRDAGSLTIRATAVALDGTLRGTISRGHQQRDPTGTRIAGRQRFATEIPLAGLFQLGFIDAFTGIPTGPAGIRLGVAQEGDADLALAIGDTLFNAGGINRVEIVSGGAIRIGDFDLGAGGALVARAGGELVLDGRVTLPSGSLELETIQPPGTRPALTITGSGRIDARGQWVNDSERLNPEGPIAPLWLAGGAVTLRAEGDLTFAPGSEIDVSGGAWFTAAGELVGGRAGSISVSSLPDAAEQTSTILSLGGTLRGFGLDDGGTLSLTAGAFAIGTLEAPSELPRTLLSTDFFRSGGFTHFELHARATPDAISEVLIDVVDGADVQVRAESLILARNYQDAPTGTDLETLATPVLLPRELRPATHLTLTTDRRLFDQGDAIASIRVGTEAALRTEARGSLSFAAYDRIIVDGLLDAPAGHIDLRLLDAGSAVGFRNEGIWLGATAELGARGADLSFVGSDGLRTGEILAGGSISVAAERGAVVIAPGALIDVSGTSGVLEVLDSAASGLPEVRALRVPTAGGRIVLEASEALLPYGDLVGRAGGAGAAAGSLRVALTLEDRVDNLGFEGAVIDVFPEDPRVLAFGERPLWREAWAAFGTPEFVTAMRTSGLDALGRIDTDRGVHGLALLAPSTVESGQFDALELGSRQSAASLQGGGTGQIFGRLLAEVRLVGDVRVDLGRSLTIDSPVLGSDGGIARLAAPNVTLGSSNNAFRVSAVDSRNLFEPLGGVGRLDVQADAIDLIGFMSLRGFGGMGASAVAPVRLAARGDIRMHGLPVPVLSNRQQNRLPEIQGAFETATDLELVAAQVYPTTLSEFTLAVRGEAGRLTITGSGAQTTPPFSAGGSLTLAARDVIQDGVVRAPLGRIDIVAGTVDATAVARVRAAATEASPYDGRRVLQAIPGSSNAGQAAVRGEVVNLAALQSSDYRLTYTGDSRYELVRLSDGFVRTFDTGTSASFTTTVVDGLRLTLADTARATAGDSYFVRHGDAAVQGSARLRPGSLTAVSGGAAAVPLGALLLENNWVLSINGVTRTLDEPRIFGTDPGAAALARRPFEAPDRPWTKRIAISGSTVRIDRGAELDLSGGGDIIAAEFRPGPGGSRDLLAGQGDSLAFALVPGHALGRSPLDPFLRFDAVSGSALSPELPAQSVADLDLRVTIGAGSSIPAGTYSVMPRGYALVPGAVLVRPDATLTDFPGGAAILSADGVPVVAAHFSIGGTDIAQQRPIGLRVEPRDLVLERAEYAIATGNEFFAGRAAARETLRPQLPFDAGRLVVSAVEGLRLGGSLTPNQTAGRGAQVDILADRIAVVARPSGAGDRVEILASELNTLGADSLMIGGSRAFTETALAVTLRASEVRVERGVVLEGPELLLGATALVDVQGRLRSSGAVQGLPVLEFTANADGSPRSRALVRVSSDRQVELRGATAPGGNVNIGRSASLFGAGSITLDGSSDVAIAGSLSTAQGSISLRTSRISLGQVPGGVGGLVLAGLDAFSAVDLRLASTSTIDIYGDLAATRTRLESLVLDAGAIRGFDVGEVAGGVIAAQQVTLRNSGAATPQPASFGSGILRIDADNIDLAGGTFAFSGFERTALQAPVITALGTTVLGSAHDVDFSTALLTAAGGARLDLDVAGRFRLLATGTLPTRYRRDRDVLQKSQGEVTGLGGRIALTAEAIDLASHVVLPSGHFEAVARDGDITLGERAVIDVAGTQRRFDIRLVGTEGGNVALSALDGSLVFAAGSVVDVSGAALDASTNTSAGRVTLAAPSATVDLVAGGLLGGFWRGSGEWQDWAAPSATHARHAGRVAIDVGHGTADYLGVAAAGGFTGGQALRLRTGDFTIASAARIEAADVSLAVDRGTLNIMGRVDASGPTGGAIQLAAGMDLVVNGDLLAHATAPATRAGEVVLQSRDGHITLASGARIAVGGRHANGAVLSSGTVRIIAPRTADNLGVEVDPLLATIDGAGRIEVVANRVYDGIARIDASETADPTQIGLSTLRAHNDAFAAAIPDLRTTLDPTAVFGAALHVLPGIEIQSAVDGNLRLTAAWALSDWRASGEPGLLTLRAAGDLRIEHSLDDGIRYRDNVDALTSFAFGAYPLVAMLRADDSWSYRLIAGADLQSASGELAAVAAADARTTRLERTGSVVLAENVRIRTGTGDIAVFAAGDLRYENLDGVVGNEAVIYTAGRHTGYGNIQYDPTELANPGALELLEFAYESRDFLGGEDTDFSPVIESVDDVVAAPFFFDRILSGAGFGEDGGDIRIAVGGDIRGPGSTQLTTDWLTVLGGERVSLLGNDSPMPTLWAVRYDRFRQNLGALGGGDVTVSAGGDIDNLSVMLPTTGRPDGEGIHYAPLNGVFTARGTPSTTVLGGGDLDLRAGGDLLGSRLLVARGHGTVRAGGRIGAVDGSALDAIFLLGEGTLDVLSTGSLTVETVANFSMVRRPLLQAQTGGAPITLNNSTRSYFFTYGQGSGLSLTSLAGDLTLDNRTREPDPIFATLLGTTGVTVDDVAAMRTYPGSFSARALGGDILVRNRFQLYPDPDSSLELLAQGSVADLGLQPDALRVRVVQSDVDPVLLPSVGAPSSGTPGIGARFEVGKRRPLVDAGWHAARPMHVEDREQSLIVALDGTVGQGRVESRGFRLFLAESARIVAGRDLLNLDFEIQHVAAADTSLVKAGRDFRYTPNRDTAGNFRQSEDDRTQGALFSGPGRGLVIAGRDIDLGTSDGIISVGNLRNFALPDGGVNLQVFAGAGAGPELAAFYRTHIQALPISESEGIAYLQDLVGDTLSQDEARAMYADLAARRRAMLGADLDVTRERSSIDPADPLAAAVLEAFFAELEASGVSATTTGSDDYSRGYTAIDTLFPRADLNGSLSMLLSRIHTEDGGDINLFVPGGSANVGAAAVSSVTKAENELGIVVQAAGNMRGYVRDDFFVNASRVFALFGGNILLWANAGDIDAGRGAKTALAAPPPQVVFDPATNQFVTVFPPEVSGSGIRNFAPPGVIPGDVFLFAPQGVISAGDAGIASAGNITIGAREVIGADNIDVGGTAIGVPQADIGVAAGLSGAAGVANAASRGAQDSASDQATSAAGIGADAFEQPTLSIINVEVLGFGG